MHRRKSRSPISSSIGTFEKFSRTPALCNRTTQTVITTVINRLSLLGRHRPNVDESRVHICYLLSLSCCFCLPNLLFFEWKDDFRWVVFVFPPSGCSLGTIMAININQSFLLMRNCSINVPPKHTHRHTHTTNPPIKKPLQGLYRCQESLKTKLPDADVSHRFFQNREF